METPGTRFSRTYTSLSLAPSSLTKMIHAVNRQQRERHTHRSSGLESGFEQLSSDGRRLEQGQKGLWRQARVTGSTLGVTAPEPSSAKSRMAKISGYCKTILIPPPQNCSYHMGAGNRNWLFQKQQVMSSAQTVFSSSI